MNTLEQYQSEVLDAMDSEMINALRTSLGLMTAHDKNKPNLRAIVAYRESDKVYNQRVEEFNEVNDARNTKRELRNGLSKQRLSEFTTGFEKITEKGTFCHSIEYANRLS